MKVMAITLMPYADLDLSFRDKYSTTWTDLPNTYYDPEKGHKLYNRYLDELEYADELGFYGVVVNEHHQTPYGMMPTPGVTAGALARRTKNAKIAVLGRALPLLNNPLTVAEEFAMLDNITGGRLITGFVRGIGSEYHSSGVNPAESHERFHEAHKLIVQAWTQPGPTSFEGKYYDFRYVNPWPRPYQQPHPPIWAPSQGSSETIEWAAKPEHKYTYCQTFSPAKLLVRFLMQYREKAEEFGYTARPDQLAWSVPVYVAETDEIARREAKEHIENLFNVFLWMPPQRLLPPGYLSLKSYQRVAQSKSAITGGFQSVDDLMAQDMFICGSPDTVADRILAYQHKLAFEYFLTLFQFATLPHDLTTKSMKMFAEHVLPRLKEEMVTEPDTARPLERAS